MGGLGHCLAGVLPGLGQVLDKKLAKKVVAKKVAKRVWRKNGGEKNNRKNRKANQANTMECHPPDKWKAKSWRKQFGEKSSAKKVGGKKWKANLRHAQKYSRPDCGHIFVRQTTTAWLRMALVKRIVCM